VKATLEDINKQFAGKKVTKEQAKEIEEKKAELRAIENTDANDVISQVATKLGEFFTTMDKIEAALHELERKSQTLQDPTESLRKLALERELVKTRLEHMEAEIRKEMCWNTPAELGDLYTRYTKMWALTMAQQEEARQKQLIKDRQEAWRRDQLKILIKGAMGWALVVALVLTEVAGLLLTIRLYQQNALPSWLDW
jgi:hypothetical protein